MVLYVRSTEYWVVQCRQVCRRGGSARPTLSPLRFCLVSMYYICRHPSATEIADPRYVALWRGGHYGLANMKQWVPLGKAQCQNVGQRATTPPPQSAPIEILQWIQWNCPRTIYIVFSAASVAPQPSNDSDNKINL
jgi:hypothetical protein